MTNNLVKLTPDVFFNPDDVRKVTRGELKAHIVFKNGDIDAIYDKETIQALFGWLDANAFDATLPKKQAHTCRNCGKAYDAPTKRVITGDVVWCYCPHCDSYEYVKSPVRKTP